nr:uncharacterized protein LOC113818109 isoform X3 [Penaeus vannamei]
MQKVHNMQQELEETVKEFHRIQETRQQYLQKCNKEILSVLKQFLNEKFRIELQEHFECRNESLEDIVKFIDNTIISACDAHEDIVNFRHQVIDIFNEGISPELAADSSDALVNQILCEMDTSMQEKHKEEKENVDALATEITTEIEKNVRLQGTLQIIQSQMDSLSERLQAPI